LSLVAAKEKLIIQKLNNKYKNDYEKKCFYLEEVSWAYFNALKSLDHDAVNN